MYLNQLCLACRWRTDIMWLKVGASEPFRWKKAARRSWSRWRSAAGWRRRHREAEVAARPHRASVRDSEGACCNLQCFCEDAHILSNRLGRFKTGGRETERANSTLFAVCCLKWRSVRVQPSDCRGPLGANTRPRGRSRNRSRSPLLVYNIVTCVYDCQIVLKIHSLF